MEFLSCAKAPIHRQHMAFLHGLNIRSVHLGVIGISPMDGDATMEAEQKRCLVLPGIEVQLHLWWSTLRLRSCHSMPFHAIPCDSMRFHDQTVFWLPLVSGEMAEEKLFDSRQPALPPTFSCQVESFSECCVMLCLRSLTRWLACNQHRPQIHQMQTCCAHQSESCISPTLRSSHLPCCDLPSGAWGYGSTYTGKRESHAKVMSKVFPTWHRNHYISTWHLFNWCTFKMLLRAASRFCFLLVLWNYRQYVHMFSSD